MINYYYCNRPGCGNLVGAEDTDTGEKEFYPGVIAVSKSEMYCAGCFDKRDVFKAPEEIYDVDELEVVDEH